MGFTQDMYVCGCWLITQTKNRTRNNSSFCQIKVKSGLGGTTAFRVFADYCFIYKQNLLVSSLYWPVLLAFLQSTTAVSTKMIKRLLHIHRSFQKHQTARNNNNNNILFIIINFFVIYYYDNIQH